MLTRSTRTFVIALSILAGAGLAACGGSSKSKTTTTTTVTDPTVPKSDITVTPDESGRTVSMKVGQTLNVELPVASGTNFAWKPGTGDKAVKTSVLEQEGAPLTVRSNPSVPGSSTVTIYRYKAVGAGTTDLWLILQNNSTGASSQSVRYIVQVA